MRVALASLMQRLERTSDVAAQRPGRDTEFVEVIMTTATAATAATPEPVASRLERSPSKRTANPSKLFESDQVEVDAVIGIDRVQQKFGRAQVRGKIVKNRVEGHAGQ